MHAIGALNGHGPGAGYSDISRIPREGLQSLSVKSFVALQSIQNKQLTAARSTAVGQSSESASLPVKIAAEIVIAAIPHIKVIARLIK
jgi:hypothetical protein